jgi:hypothetical protein
LPSKAWLIGITKLSLVTRYNKRHELDVNQLQSLLKREYDAITGNSEVRKQILDLIDLMLQHEVYGVDNVISEHER